MAVVEEHEVGGQEPASVDDISLGRTLREAREQQELSIEDVVNQIKLAPSQIEALEAEDYASLPETTFVRGFVRSYAKLLLIDSAPLLALLPTENHVPSLDETSTKSIFFDSKILQRKNLIWLSSAVFMMVLVVIVAVWGFTTSEEKSPPQLEEFPLELPENIEIITSSSIGEVASDVSITSPDKAAVISATPEDNLIQKEDRQSAAPKVGALRLVFDEESWVEIRDKNRLLSSQINLSGSELIVDGNPPFSLVVGRSDAVHLYYRGNKVDLSPNTHSSSGVARLTLE